MQNTPNLVAALGELPDLSPLLGGGKLVCPLGYGYYTGSSLTDVNKFCQEVSLPLLANNAIWRNRAFHVEVGDLGTGQANQQSVVTLVPSLNQTLTGMCTTLGTDNGAAGSGGPVNYWDIGVRGDVGPTSHNSGYQMVPRFSILSSGDYTGNGNLVGSDPAVVASYCNGSRLPPEGGGLFAGFRAPAGRAETTGLYPVFKLNQTVVAATVDEGNNWINLSYGPLSLSNSASYTSKGISLPPLGDYHLQSSSPARDSGINVILPAIPILFPNPVLAPTTDFFGNPRTGRPDIGAAEYIP
jgi:hypothetical protein